MRLAFVAAALLSALSLAPPAAAHDGPHVNDAYALASARSGAVFLVIENHSAEDDRLVGVASDVAERVELHTHAIGADGVARMIAVPEGFAVPGHGTHVLQRGGDHVMLMGLTRPLKDGDTFPLVLTFQRGEVVTVEVTVDNDRAPGAAMDHGSMDHSGHAAP